MSYIDIVETTLTDEEFDILSNSTEDIYSLD